MKVNSTQMPRLLVWADDHNWSASARQRLLRNFEPLRASQDIRAARGEGASGISPEVQLLIITSYLAYR